MQNFVCAPLACTPLHMHPLCMHPCMCTSCMHLASSWLAKAPHHNPQRPVDVETTHRDPQRPPVETHGEGGGGGRGCAWLGCAWWGHAWLEACVVGGMCDGGGMGGGRGCVWWRGVHGGGNVHAWGHVWWWWGACMVVGPAWWLGGHALWKKSHLRISTTWAPTSGHSCKVNFMMVHNHNTLSYAPNPWILRLYIKTPMYRVANDLSQMQK